MAKKHPGFQAVQSKIASKEGISQDRAGAILAASSRGASKAAKKANPRLKKVHGGNTMISRGSMKGKALTEGPKSNKMLKNDFTNGGQRSDNLSLKENPDKTPLPRPDKK